MYADGRGGLSNDLEGFSTHFTDFHSVISGNSMLSETNHVSLLLAFQSFS